MERMGDEKIEKRADAQKAEIKRKRRSSVLRWTKLYIKRHGKMREHWRTNITDEKIELENVKGKKVNYFVAYT